MSEWTWVYEGYDPESERLREALCTLGNGYFATRGAAPEAPRGGPHYPATYAAGCYNRLASDVGGRLVENEDMVNLPDWLPLRFRFRTGREPGPPWLTPDGGRLTDYRQTLDLRRGLLLRNMRYAVADGVFLIVQQTRLVHMGDPHLAAMRTVFTAEGADGVLEIESALDGDVTNSGVDRYRDLDGRHLTGLRAGAEEPGTVWLRCRTTTSDIRIAMAARTTVAVGTPGDKGAGAGRAGTGEPGTRAGGPVTVDGRRAEERERAAGQRQAPDRDAGAGRRERDRAPGRERPQAADTDADGTGTGETGTGRTGTGTRTTGTRTTGTGTDVGVRAAVSDTSAATVITTPLVPGGSVTVEKTVTLHTSHDRAISDPHRAALDRIGRAPGFAGLLGSHATAWELLWRRAELHVPNEAGRILRLHLFHVLQTLSPHTADLDVGVPARGLHGEAYRGHVFWDELFVLPSLNLHLPEVSRSLLEYRYRRLPQACRAASDVGRAGAMFPWQSGSDGREETQEVHLNPRSGRWLPDHSRLQHHVGSAIAYNVWQYCQATGDTDFLHTKGAELLMQIARFWADAAVLDPSFGRYRIRGVVGPDEYHEAYPDAPVPGLDDNAYTNVTAAWVLSRALDLAGTLPGPRRRELFERIRLAPDELERWEDVSRRLRVPFHEGVISQFEGYGELEELDWNGYTSRYGDIRRLDRVLEAEGDSTNRYRASKQADVLMLGYLFSPGELAGLFRRLGYDLDDATWRRTVDYYLHRTSHGSTLSGLVHGWVLARVRRAEAWKFVQEALVGDVADIQGGTTEEGIHLGAMAGTVDLVQRGLPGLETREDALWLDPVPLPEMADLSAYGFTMRYRGHWGIGVRMAAGQVTISMPDSEELPIRVVLAGRSVTVEPGETYRLILP